MIYILITRLADLMSVISICFSDDDLVESAKSRQNSDGTSTPMPSHLKPTDHPVLPKHQTLPANSFISVSTGAVVKLL